MNAKEIRRIRKEIGLTQEEFAKLIGVSKNSVQLWETNKRNASQSVVLLIEETYRKHTAMSIQEMTPMYSEEDSQGVPYYDVDFTASFLEVENNQSITPTSYVSHPFFLGCDFVVRASGQSMAKVIKHGDAVGLVKIENWMDFIPMGEIYAIVTSNGFRMIKVISPGQEKDTYTLISKPTDGKKDEFPNQQIKKSLISHIYKVQASSHLF